MSRPFVFIGSSTEGLRYAKAIQAELARVAECEIWSQGAFGLSDGNLESLIKAVDRFDFAILVITPDDAGIMRNEKHTIPRDNVLFELGLFIGGIGRDRTFMVMDRSARIKLPTDLAGITPATFEPPKKSSEQAAVGPACTAIENAINNRGLRHPVPIHISCSFEFSAHGHKRSICLKVTNVGGKDFPPHTLELFHPKRGRFIFDSPDSGVLLADQQRVHKFHLIDKGVFPDLLQILEIDDEGKPVDPALFEIRVVLDRSDKVLFANKRIARGLVKLLKLAKANGCWGGGTHEDWLELNSSLPDEVSSPK